MHVCLPPEDRLKIDLQDAIDRNAINRQKNTKEYNFLDGLGSTFLNELTQMKPGSQIVTKDNKNT
jgi:hypothetical protein